MTASGLTMLLPIVRATSCPRMAPTRLSDAAMMTATTGESTRVETTVAMALPLSCAPFVKSKTSATRMMAMSRKGVLNIFQNHAFNHMCKVVHQVNGRFKTVIDMSPLNGPHRHIGLSILAFIELPQRHQ